LICKKKKIDADDYFGLLLEVGQGDTVGAVRVVKVEIG
jgi:HipA-like protein